MLLRKLVADGRERLGINGVDEIKAHPFFTGINWAKLRYNFNNLEIKNHLIYLKLRTFGIHKISIHMMKKNPGFLQIQKVKKERKRIHNLLVIHTNQLKIATLPW